MKKVLGIFGVVAVAAVMFFNTNNVNGSTLDTSLSSFVGMNSANAEDGGSYVRCALVSADLCILTNFGAYQGYRY